MATSPSGILHSARIRYLFAGLLLTSACRQSPELPPNSLHFQVDMRGPAESGWFDPATETVGIRGNTLPLSWGNTLPARDSDGDLVYDATVVFTESLSMPVAFKFKVDGVDNPNDGWQVGRNHALLVTAATTFARAFDDEADPLPPTFSGNIVTHENFSAPGNALRPRDLFVFLPPGYMESGMRYPVLYMHDGRNVFDASEAGGEWRMDELATALVDSGLVEPFIIVGVGNTADRIREYTPSVSQSAHVFRRRNTESAAGRGDKYTGLYVADDQSTISVTERDGGVFFKRNDTPEALAGEPQGDGEYRIAGSEFRLQFIMSDVGKAVVLVARERPRGGAGNEYGRFLVEGVKPFIDDEYRTLPDAANTALGGSSLGGLISLHLGLKYPDVFGQLLVVSPSIWWDDQFVLKEVEQLPSATSQRIWVDVGDREGEEMVSGARALNTELIAKGWTNESLHFVLDAGAEHSERAWAGRAREMLLFLYGK